MTSNQTDAHRSRAQHTRHPGVATTRQLRARARPDPLTVQSIVSFSSNSLKRKKSSDSASTGTAVTAPEDEGGYGMRHRDQESDRLAPAASASTPARPFITRRHSRPRTEETRDARSERDPAGREPSRRHAPYSVSGANVPLRRENEYVSTDHARRDKGKGVDRTGTSHASSSSRRFLVDAAEREDTPRDRHHDRVERHAYSGPLAHAEFDRLRKDIEVWKRSATDHRKVVKKQAKKIEELKAQILAETTARKEQETELQTLKTSAGKREELITAIDNSLQCQICMDILQRPYALSPCGHILCLICLQEWFRKAPPSADDSDMDLNEQEDPYYILRRAKSCPCCRAVVKRRPVPVFVVKAVTTALTKYKTGAGEGSLGDAGRRSPSPDQEDPWRGLFESSEDEEADVDEGDIDSSDDDEYADAVGWAMRGLHGGIQGELARQFVVNQRRYMLRYDDDDDDDSGSASGSASGSEEDEDVAAGGESLDEEGSDEYDTIYVPAQWEPPSVTVHPEDYIFMNESLTAPTLCMLRRGCTLDMIRIFAMSYSHSRGLVAHLPSLDELWPFPDDGTDDIPRNNRVFLGWNVSLGVADNSGERYMRAVLGDLKENPARWTWAERSLARGAYDVKRLVPVEEAEDYDTTDTDVWLDANDPYH